MLVISKSHRTETPRSGGVQPQPEPPFGAETMRPSFGFNPFHEQKLQKSRMQNISVDIIGVYGRVSVQTPTLPGPSRRVSSTAHHLAQLVVAHRQRVH